MAINNIQKSVSNYSILAFIIFSWLAQFVIAWTGSLICGSQKDNNAAGACTKSFFYFTVAFGLVSIFLTVRALMMTKMPA